MSINDHTDMFYSLLSRQSSIFFLFVANEIKTHATYAPSQLFSMCWFLKTLLSHLHDARPPILSIFF